MEEELFSLVQECSNTYSVEDLNDKEVEIRILLPKKFRSLWLSKLSALRTTAEEIADHAESDESQTKH